MDEKKHKKKLDGAQGGGVGTHAVPDGRVREDNPPKLWSNFGQDSRDADQGRRIENASARPPHPEMASPANG